MVTLENDAEDAFASRLVPPDIGTQERGIKVDFGVSGRGRMLQREVRSKQVARDVGDTRHLV